MDYSEVDINSTLLCSTNYNNIKKTALNESEKVIIYDCIIDNENKLWNTKISTNLTEFYSKYLYDNEFKYIYEVDYILKDTYSSKINNYLQALNFYNKYLKIKASFSNKDVVNNNNNNFDLKTNLNIFLEYLAQGIMNNESNSLVLLSNYINNTKYLDRINKNKTKYTTYNYNKTKLFSILSVINLNLEDDLKIVNYTLNSDNNIYLYMISHCISMVIDILKSVLYSNLSLSLLYSNFSLCILKILLNSDNSEVMSIISNYLYYDVLADLLKNQPFKLNINKNEIKTLQIIVNLLSYNNCTFNCLNSVNNNLFNKNNSLDNEYNKIIEYDEIRYNKLICELENNHNKYRSDYNLYWLLYFLFKQINSNVFNIEFNLKKSMYKLINLINSNLNEILFVNSDSKVLAMFIDNFLFNLYSYRLYCNEKYNTNINVYFDKIEEFIVNNYDLINLKLKTDCYFTTNYILNLYKNYNNIVFDNNNLTNIKDIDSFENSFNCKNNNLILVLYKAISLGDLKAIYYFYYLLNNYSSGLKNSYFENDKSNEFYNYNNLNMYNIRNLRSSIFLFKSAYSQMHLLLNKVLDCITALTEYNSCKIKEAKYFIDSTCLCDNISLIKELIFILANLHYKGILCNQDNNKALDIILILNKYIILYYNYDNLYIPNTKEDFKLLSLYIKISIKFINNNINIDKNIDKFYELIELYIREFVNFLIYTNKLKNKVDNTDSNTSIDINKDLNELYNRYIKLNNFGYLEYEFIRIINMSKEMLFDNYFKSKLQNNLNVYSKINILEQVIDNGVYLYNSLIKVFNLSYNKLTQLNNEFTCCFDVEVSKYLIYKCYNYIKSHFLLNNDITNYNINNSLAINNNNINLKNKFIYDELNSCKHCLLCKDPNSKRTILNDTCEHKVLCESCGSDFKNNLNDDLICDICSTKIDRIIKIYNK